MPDVPDMEPEDHAMTHWRIDKRIPVALLLFIGIQTAGAFWWAATMSANMGALTQRVEVLEKNNALMTAQTAQLAAMDARMMSMQESIKELKGLVMTLMASPRIPIGEKTH